MIILFHGADKKLRDKLVAFERAAQKKYPDMVTVRVTPDVFEESFVEEYIKGRSLFAPRVMVVFDGLCDVASTKKVIFEHLVHIEKSDNVFLFVADALSSVDPALLKKHAKEEHHFPEKKEKKEEFPIFVLANALAGRNAEKMWVLYREALARGVAPEALRGMLHWKVRDMMGKSEGAYSKEELSYLSRGLVGLFEQSEGQTGEEALEVWCLSIEKSYSTTLHESASLR